MEGVFPIVHGEPVFPAVQLKAAAGYAIGIAAHAGAQIAVACHIAFKIGIAQHHIAHFSVFVRRRQPGYGRAVVCGGPNININKCTYVTIVRILALKKSPIC